MTALFKTPKVSVPQAADPPAVPTIDDASRARNEAGRLRRRRGMAGNIVAGGLGLTVPGASAPPKTLTGQ